jgi:hypothetical protein
MKEKSSSHREYQKYLYLSKINGIKTHSVTGKAKTKQRQSKDKDKAMMFRACGEGTPEHSMKSRLVVAIPLKRLAWF